MPGLVLTDEPSRAPRAGIVLAPGSSGSVDSPGWTTLAETLAGLGYLVARFELPYRQQGRKIPPKAEASVPGYVEAFDGVRRDHPSTRDWYLGGKSYGGRVASLAVAGGIQATGLIFIGYPLHAPGRKDRLRIEHWPQIVVPALFLQGTSDPMCDLALLETSLPLLGAKASLRAIEGANHSLGVGRAQPDFAGFAHIIHAWILGGI